MVTLFYHASEVPSQSGRLQVSGHRLWTWGSTYWEATVWEATVWEATVCKYRCVPKIGFRCKKWKKMKNNQKEAKPVKNENAKCKVITKWGEKFSVVAIFCVNWKKLERERFKNPRGDRAESTKSKTKGKKLRSAKPLRFMWKNFNTIEKQYCFAKNSSENASGTLAGSRPELE